MKKLIIATIAALFLIGCKSNESLMVLQCEFFSGTVELNKNLEANRSVNSSVYEMSYPEDPSVTVLVPRNRCIAFIKNNR